MSVEIDTDEYDDAANMAIMDRLDRIGDAHKLKSRWCVEGIEDIEALSSDHPFRDAHTLTYTTLRYGDHPAITVTTPIKGDSWMDLWKATEQIFRKSCEVDHRFVEGFNPTSKLGELIVRLGS